MTPAGCWLFLIAAVASGLSLTHALEPNPAYPKSKNPTGTVPLFVVSNQVLGDARDQVTYQTLAGHLARDTPQLYRVATDLNGTDGTAFWLRNMVNDPKYGLKINTTFLSDWNGLLEHFAAQIDGYVVFNVSTESVNAAITYCAAADTIVLAAANPATIATLSSLGVKKLADLSSATVASVYAKVKANLVLRGITCQPPSKSTNLAEFSVFAKFPTAEYEGDDGGPTVNAILTDLAAEGNNSIVMGWGPEIQYVHQVGSYSAYVHASDWSSDLGALANLPVVSQHPRTPRPFNASGRFTRQQQQQRQEQREPRGPLHSQDAQDRASNGGRHTAAFLMTDGDNIQWMINAWANQQQWFGSSDRGKVPMGWTVSPALYSLAPPILNFIHSSLTTNDSIVAAPSGVGYIYPDSFRDMSGFAEMTGDYMNACGMSTLNVLADTPYSATHNVFAEQDHIGSIFLYSGSCYAGPAGQSGFIGDDVLVVTGRAAMWGDGPVGQCRGVDAIVKLVESLPTDPSLPSAYSLIPVHAWTHNMSDVVSAATQLMNAGVNVVTPAQLVALMKANIKTRCAWPSGSFEDTCDNCSVDDNCILTCDCKDGVHEAPSGTAATPVVHTTCNTNCCSGELISNNDGNLFCAGRVCPATPSC